MTLPVVAIASNGTEPNSEYSTAPTTTWTGGGNTPTYTNGSASGWHAICYSPALTMLVIGQFTGTYNNNNMLARSTDNGLTWTGVTQSGIDGASTGWVVQSICWSAAKALFVAVCSGGPTTTKRVLTSPDGVTWTARVLPDASKSLFGVCYSPELALFVAVGTANAVYTSPDGTTWTARTGGGTTQDWVSVVWAGDGTGGGVQKFVAASGQSTTIGLIYSSDGSSWTQTGSGGTRPPTHLAYSPSLDIIAGTGGNTGFVAYTTAHSVTSWSQINSGLGNDGYQAICWSSALGFVGVANHTDVLTSTDGVTWASNNNNRWISWQGIVAIEAAPGENGTLAATDLADTFAALGYPGFPFPTGEFAATETKDLFTGAAFQPVVAHMTLFGQKDIFSGFIKQTVLASWASTEAKDTFHGEAFTVGVGASWASIEAVDVFAAAGYTPVSGTFVTTGPADIFVAVGQGAIVNPPRRVFFVG